MNKKEDIFININASLHDALVLLDATMKKQLICVDGEKKLMGLLTDGDIRRALIKVCDLNMPVSEAMSENPVFVNMQIQPQEVHTLLSVNIQIIPVIDEDEIVVGYYSFKENLPFDSVTNKTITILGMGYVGLTLALRLADIGFQVKGFDTNTELIEMLKRSEPPFFEEGLERYLDIYANKNLIFTTSIKESKSDIYIITVGTPLQPNNKLPNIGHINKACESIGSLLESGNLVLLRSTVPIGCSREVVLPSLEKTSGLKCGEDFSLAFTPERTAEGLALKELTENPQIIGAFDQVSYDITAQLFNCITHSVINVDSLEAAEMAKLMDNTFRDHMFAYSNYMATLAERLGLNIHNIINAVNFGYKRNTVPRPSPGVGGPCLSKDPYILRSIFDKFGIDSSVITSTRTVNELGPVLMKDKLNKLLKSAGKDLISAKKISLIGLAFKGEPETSDLRDSTALWFLNLIPKKENIYCFDPVVKDEDIKELGITPVSLEEAFKGSDAIVILNNHRSYANWHLTSLLESMNKPAVIIDTWNNFNPLFFKRQRGILYGGLGND